MVSFLPISAGINNSHHSLFFFFFLILSMIVFFNIDVTHGEAGLSALVVVVPLVV